MDKEIRRLLSMLIKLLDLRDEYEHNPRLWDVDLRRRMLGVIKNDVTEQRRAQIEKLEQIMDIAELIKISGMEGG
jgi:hypothetical protein